MHLDTPVRRSLVLILVAVSTSVAAAAAKGDKATRTPAREPKRSGTAAPAARPTLSRHQASRRDVAQLKRRIGEITTLRSAAADLTFSDETGATPKAALQPANNPLCSYSPSGNSSKATSIRG